MARKGITCNAICPGYVLTGARRGRAARVGEGLRTAHALRRALGARTLRRTAAGTQASAATACPLLPPGARPDLIKNQLKDQAKTRGITEEQVRALWGGLGATAQRGHSAAGRAHTACQAGR